MKTISRYIMTLVALLAVTTGAWAEDTYTITFAANGNTKTVENVALPKTFQCSYDNADGELDLILKELYSWSGDKNKTFCDVETTPNSSDENKVVAGNDNGDHYITINNVFEGTVTITGYYVVNSVVIETPYSLEISIAAPASSGPEVAWDKAEKTGTFTMPGGNVTLEPEYYPQAALTAAPTAINDVPATTDGAIVNAGTVANIGSTETAQGTVMYYVSQTALDDAALLALAADQWTADVPTAESLAQGQAYVYYYVRGNDSDNDEENFSDGDILAANALTVTIAAEPTYAVTFVEGTNLNEWTASPNAGVKKGTEVTVTYSGSKKVLGVKAEKKKEDNPYANAKLGDLFYSDGTFSATLEAGKTPIGVIAYLDKEGTDDDEISEKSNGAGHGLVLCLKDAASDTEWSTEEVSKFSGQEVTSVDGMKRTTNVSGYTNTATLTVDAATAEKYPAAKAAKEYTTLTAPAGTTGWFLPSAQQLLKIIEGLGGLTDGAPNFDNKFFDTNHEGADKLEAALSKAGSGNYDSMTSDNDYLWYWSSSECTENQAVALGIDASGTGFGHGFFWDNDYKSGGHSNNHVRPVLAF